MDPFNPHPPIDHASYIFHTFARLYFTTCQPIDFTKGKTFEQLFPIFKKHSLEARQVLLHLYNVLRPLVTHNQVQEQQLESAYLYAVTLIHQKFGTTQTTNPLIHHTLG